MPSAASAGPGQVGERAAAVRARVGGRQALPGGGGHHVEPAARGRLRPGWPAHRRRARAAPARPARCPRPRCRGEQPVEPAGSRPIVTRAAAGVGRTDRSRPAASSSSPRPLTRATVARALLGEGLRPVAGAADRAGHRGDRVAVPAQRRGHPAGQPGVVRGGRQHGERGGHRLLGGQAGADQPVHHVQRLRPGRARRPARSPR